MRTRALRFVLASHAFAAPMTPYQSYWATAPRSDCSSAGSRVIPMRRKHSRSKYSISSDDCATLQRHVTAKRDGLGRFFVAATDRAAAAPSRRLFALLDGELMFRSTGTSNPGRNYPGMWLPTAGICPWWFQQPAAGRPTSFAEITDDTTALRAGAEQRVFDKRFAFAYHENEDLEAWAALRDDLRSMAATDGNGRFAFDRFTSLRQLVVSIRLGREAWVDAGLGAAAAEVLARGAAAGLLPTLSPRRALAGRRRGPCVR